MSGKGVYKWTAIDRICNSVMTFGGNILLANLLSPSDFGLLAMVAIFTALAYNISGCGMSDGLINKENPSDRDYSTVFFFNVSTGVVFCIAFIASSSLIADYFGYEELKGIMIAIGICFFFQSMCLIQETKMRKELDFKKLAIVRLSATASSLILAVILVLSGYSYWGLVSMQVFLSFFLFVYYILVSRWIPRLAFYRDSFKEMFGYGIHLMLAYICYQFARNINTSVLGKYWQASAAGAYNQGQKLQEVPYSLIEAILNWPFFAVLSSTNDKAERRRLTAQMHSMIVFVNTGVTAFLFVVSSYTFRALYGAKWDASIPIFNILLIFGLATALKMFYQTIFKAHAMTKLIRNLTFVEVIAQICLLACFYDYSIEMIAFTTVIPSVAVLLVYIVYYIRVEEIDFGTFIREAGRPMLLPAAVLVLSLLATAFWAPDLNRFVALPVVALIFAAIFITVCEIVRPQPYLDLRARFVKNNNSADQ